MNSVPFAQPSLLEIALYLADNAARRWDEIWVQLHEPFDEAQADRVAGLLEELGFEPAPPDMYHTHFSDRSSLTEAANKLIREVGELPLRLRFRICLPHEDNQIFLPETLWPGPAGRA